MNELLSELSHRLKTCWASNEVCYLSLALKFEKDKNNEYNRMAIAYDSTANRRYLESFFHETSDSYISGQINVKISNYKLFDKDGNIIFEDAFK